MSDTGRELSRRQVVAELLHDARDLTIISGLGGPTWDVAAAAPAGPHFGLWGAMGLAVTTGMGVALAQPSRATVVFTGDGEMLMGLGSMATAANSSVNNLAIVVLDNQRYGETGGQETHTAGVTNLAETILVLKSLDY